MSGNATLSAIEAVYECGDFAAVNKPAGILVHPRLAASETVDFDGTVAGWALEHYPEVKMVGDKPDIRPGIVHRLDKDTSGILIVARTQEFFDYFKQLLRDRKVKKTYTALVCGKLPKKGSVDAPIALRSGTIRRTAHTKGQKMEKDALTEYKALKYYTRGGESFTLAELVPKTGRTHQLRVHMSHIHHPIVGDCLYGGKASCPTLGVGQRLMLHALSLEFKDRSGTNLHLEAPLPDDFQDILKALNAGCLVK